MTGNSSLLNLILHVPHSLYLVDFELENSII